MVRLEHLLPLRQKIIFRYQQLGLNHKQSSAFQQIADIPNLENLSVFHFQNTGTFRHTPTAHGLELK